MTRKYNDAEKAAAHRAGLIYADNRGPLYESIGPWWHGEIKAMARRATQEAEDLYIVAAAMERELQKENNQDTA